MNFFLSFLAAREPWLRTFTYSLFIFSVISITGVEFSVIVLFLLAIISRFRSARSTDLPIWLVVPFSVWIFVAALSSLVNPEWLANLASLRHQYRIILPFALLISLEHVNPKRLLLVYLSLVCVIAVYSWLQFYFAIDVLRMDGTRPFSGIGRTPTGEMTFRARGFFVGPGILANHMMMIGLLFYGLAVGCRNGPRKIWAFGAAMAMVGLIFSFGRSAWLGTMVGVLILAFQLPRRWAISLFTVGGIVFMIGSFLVVSGWMDRQIGESVDSVVLKRLAASTTENSEILLRLVMWKAGIAAIKQKPWLGYGYENRKAAVAYLPPKSPAVPWKVPIRKTGLDLHNMYLQVAYDFGLLGLAAYLSIWLAIFVWNGLWIARAGRAMQFESSILWGASAGLAGSMVDGFFHNSFFSGNTNATILIFMGLSLYAGSRIRDGLGKTRAH